MQDTLELLLKDIYALDPSLRERDTEVRALVHELLLHKPTVEISGDFASNLRTKLLSHKVALVPSPYSISSPWMRYLAPVGVVAVLLLMLVPNYVGQPTKYDSVVPSSVPDTFMTPESKRGMDQDMESAATMMMADEAMPAVEGNNLAVGFQTPGVVVLVDYAALLEPGFVVITRSVAGQAGEVLGVSYLLFAGLTEQIEIPLKEPMKAGESFTATLYLDNGDGAFDLNLDMPVLDMEGQSPLAQEFFSTP